MSGPKLNGIMSKRDYTRKIALKEKPSKETPVGEIISKPVLWVTPEHTVEDCLRLMTNARVRHLPVLDGERVVGVVSIGEHLWKLSRLSSGCRLRFSNHTSRPLISGFQYYI